MYGSSLDENSLLCTSGESEAAVFSVGYGGATLNQPWDIDHNFGIDATDPQLACVQSQSLIEPPLFDPPGNPIISSVQPAATRVCRQSSCKLGRQSIL